MLEALLSSKGVTSIYALIKSWRPTSTDDKHDHYLFNPLMLIRVPKFAKKKKKKIEKKPHDLIFVVVKIADNF